MYKHETIAFLATAFFLFIALQQSKIIPLLFSEKILRVFIWIMAFVFSANFLGNLFSRNILEKFVFSLLALVLAVCCWLILLY